MLNEIEQAEKEYQRLMASHPRSDSSDIDEDLNDRVDIGASFQANAVEPLISEIKTLIENNTSGVQGGD